MTMRMLIDARHREETRVAVVKGNRIEEFDFESAERKQLKGNIYLAKVTRVEPSLQAAFIEYGGNRHGFLAFSEIHPDYYQIPKEDRDALLREEAEHAAEEAALRAAEDAHLDDEDGEAFGEDGFGGDEGDDHHDHDDDAHDDDGEQGDEDGDGTAAEGEAAGEAPRRGRGRRRGGSGGDDSAAEALRQKRMNLRRRYKIQDVIRRRQVLLVQVVKEERGNKGAALTTYLSLAGRYCVLMPNTSHGGGISRKISNAGDRKRLKSIMADLKLPSSMGCIVRTAGLQRTQVEIKRDFDYLARLWDEIRERTLSSAAPALVYGDSDLIKRAIRDIYNRDIDEVIVEGEDGYRQAKEFMRLLMPSHARRVTHYSDAVPLFQRHHVEDQLAAMYNPVVQLKSGGYLVINPTEALVSIDINSGRSTREHNIEQTATATNLEAADEIARQLRLRDMAGLVVIDFIDMDNGSNVRKVEKAMKAALSGDRARIQVGRISSFGLMEMSRQRLRTGVLEASTRQCPHCEGTGLVRTASSSGLSALRLLEDEAARGRGSQLLLRASTEAAFYLLNKKRHDIAEIEDRYGVFIEVSQDGEPEGARMAVEVGGPPPVHAPRIAPVIEDSEDDFVEEDEVFEDEEEIVEAREPRAPREPRGDGQDRSPRGDDEERSRRKRRRRGRRGRRDEQDGEGQTAGEDMPDDGGDADLPAGDNAEGFTNEDEPGTDSAASATDEEGGERRRRRRRGRRGGRRDEAPRSAEAGEGGEPDAVKADVEADAEPAVTGEADAETPVEAAAAKRPRRRPRAAAPDPAAIDPTALTTAEPADVAVAEAVAEEPAAKPKRTRRKKADAAPAAEDAAVVEPPVEQAVEPGPAADEAPAKPKRTRRRKADAPTDAAADADAEAPAAEPAPPANDPEDAADPPEAAGEAGGSATPRRGWWQRTFGN